MSDSRIRLWHPHQGLWNWELVGRLRSFRFGQHLESVVIWSDTLILLWRCRIWRRKRPIMDARVLVLDCGVHREGWQIVAVDEWFRTEVRELSIIGFEANPQTYEIAKQTLGSIPRLELRNIALVGLAHDSLEVELFLTTGGKSDSLLPQRDELGSVVVRAGRLSTELPDLAGFDAVFLRMNIEGAERDVIADLEAAGLIDCITGFLGMWDDLSKIDPAADEQFRRDLARLGISTFTFNDRDFKNPLRAQRARTQIVHRIRLAAIRHRMWLQIASSSSRDRGVRRHPRDRSATV